VIYADLNMLRRGGVLGLLANIEVAPDKGYDAFINETGFDYTRDLDAIAIATDQSQIFLVGRGRFHWDRLKGFAISHHGSCEADACRVAATTAGRWVNLIAIQPDVLAVAISPDRAGADDLRPPGRRRQQEIPAAPIWAKPSHFFLTHPAGLPVPVQIFAISLQSAESVIISAQLQSVQLKAHFSNAATADTARSQLEIQTRRLTSALVVDHEKPDRASMAGLLTAGTFQVIGTDVVGVWPIYSELLKALQ
jgi:hypothetical protein